MADPAKDGLILRPDEQLALAQSGFVERGLALADSLLEQNDRASTSTQFATAPPIQFDWVTIPAGKFLMGSDKRKDTLAYDDEIPQHWLYLPTYRITRTPVTVAQFAAFVYATGYSTEAENSDHRPYSIKGKLELVKGVNWLHPHGPDSDVVQKESHPVTWITWNDAQAFCAWASNVTGQTVQLPSEAEWEKAARGSDGRIYPWGDGAATDWLCNFAGKVGDTTSVDHYPEGASPFGVLDMAGNVFEWTLSQLHIRSQPESEYFYPYDPTDGRENLAASIFMCRTLRGGSFIYDASYIRCANRDRLEPYACHADVGFRVVSSDFPFHIYAR